jgi:Tfp pilus assembly protein PilV
MNELRREPSGVTDPEAGFTLIEALIAIVVLIVGLAAVSNLMLVAASSNQTGNNLSMTTAEATARMEALKQIPFGTAPFVGAAPQGDLAANTPGFFTQRTFPGGAQVTTRWLVQNPCPGAYHITVQSTTNQILSGGPRSQATLNHLRACTVPGCLGTICIP